ncbi:MAG: hypothetical protein MUF72_13305 [Elainella sp. Prado103]|nr:hypothetical protein [Elainella sp. Prado103]
MKQSPQPSRSSGQSKPVHRSRTQALLQLVQQLVGIGLAFIPILFKTVKQVGQQLLISLQQLHRQWMAALPRIRQALPAWSRHIPDWGMTTIATTLLLLLVGLPIGLVRQPAPAPTTAQQPEPASPQNHLPAKPARLTAIQTQLTEIANRYQEDLIQATQLNFPGHCLILVVAESWRSLPIEQREQLANELLQRSQKLSFQILDIQDENGNTLARSPVVGAKMVMFSQAA